MREREFINLELTQEQIADYRSWRDDTEAVLQTWTEALEAGYKINTKYDDYSSSIACFMFAPEDEPNSEFILTGRGGNAFRAVSEALYKHEHIFRGDWTNNPVRKRGGDDPDF